MTYPNQVRGFVHHIGFGFSFGFEFLGSRIAADPTVIRAAMIKKATIEPPIPYTSAVRPATKAPRTAPPIRKVLKAPKISPRRAGLATSATMAEAAGLLMPEPRPKRMGGFLPTLSESLPLGIWAKSWTAPYTDMITPRRV